MGNYQPRERTTKAPIEWPFTTSNIPYPIVDWSKPPIFDKEHLENYRKSRSVAKKNVVSMFMLLETNVE